MLGCQPLEGVPPELSRVLRDASKLTVAAAIFEPAASALCLAASSSSFNYIKI